MPQSLSSTAEIDKPEQLNNNNRVPGQMYSIIQAGDPGQMNNKRVLPRRAARQKLISLQKNKQL